MRGILRHRIALAVAALVTALGWVWSSTSARVAEPQKIAAMAIGGGFGAAEEPAKPEPAPRIYFSTPVNGEVAATWDKLQKKVALKFATETSLADVLRFIKVASADEDEPGLQFYVDPVGLAEAEKTMTSAVTIDLEGVPLSTCLELVLKQLDLGFSVQKDGLVIITHKNSADHAVDPTLLILDELQALRREVRMLQNARVGGGMGGGMGGAAGGAGGGGGGMR